MKRVFGIIAVATFFLNAGAQIAVNDSVNTSSENKDMTFYNLQTGQKTVASNSDWHLAVSVRQAAFVWNGSCILIL